MLTEVLPQPLPCDSAFIHCFVRLLAGISSMPHLFDHWNFRITLRRAITDQCV
jgi:hypothetical protein